MEKIPHYSSCEWRRFGFKTTNEKQRQAAYELTVRKGLSRDDLALLLKTFSIEVDAFAPTEY